ncbi:HMG box domain-containing protein [Entamoeba marina]
MSSKAPKSKSTTATKNASTKKTPKRPMGAYFNFTKDKREEIAATLKEGENINKKLGEVWGKLTDAEKKPYQDQYNKEKKEIEEAKQEKKEKAAKGLKAAREAAKNKKGAK